jgi:outer membrane protein assembly factor BamB
LAFIAACSAAIATPTFFEIGVFADPAQAVNTTISGWHVVSAPVAAGHTAVVITVDGSHLLQLSDVDPVSGEKIWQVPYSASDVTPGVYLSPAVADGIVLDVAPARNPANPAVDLSGIDAATGTKQWSLSSSVVLSDNPAPCVANQDFCVTGYNSDGSSEMVILDATTGHPVNLLPGPNRALGVGLYQSDATTPTLEQLTATGAIGWTEPASSIFGPGYDPADGWNITPVGSLDIGSIAATISGNTINLANIKTVGFSIATGANVWSVPGSYMCMGPLQFLSTQIACQYTGSLQKPSKPTATPSMRGVTLKLTGFNPTNGAIEWTQPVGNVTAMSTGNGLSFVDGTHLSVTLPNGKQELLNTSTGTLTPLKSSAVLWCQKLPIYKVTALKGIEGGGMRQSAPAYFPCTPNGQATSKIPASFPSTVGTMIDGTFVWPSPDGLKTHTVAAPHSDA